jgi:hypothetical protein
MAEKDSYWFRHDSTAGRGLKMRKMAHIYKHWGKGIYWDVVEILRDQKEYKFESDESSLQLLCDLIGCKDEVRFISWFNDSLNLGLFELDGKYFFNPPLRKNMIRWEASKNNGSKGGRPIKKPKNNLINNLNGNLNETIIEQYSIEESINNIYNKFVDEVKSGNHAQAIEQWYMRLKIKEGSLTPLLKDFKGQLIIEGKAHKNINELKKHFNNWLNKQEEVGRLNQYKKVKTL